MAAVSRTSPRYARIRCGSRNKRGVLILSTDVTPKTPAALQAFDQRTVRMSGGASVGIAAPRSRAIAAATRGLGSVGPEPISPR